MRTITLTEQPDGNWIGETQRDGKTITSREVSPEYALQNLLTHE